MGQVPPPAHVVADVHEVCTQPGKVGVLQIEVRPLHAAGAEVLRSPQQSLVSVQSIRSQCFASTAISNSFLAQMPFRQAKPVLQSLRAWQFSPR